MEAIPVSDLLHERKEGQNLIVFRLLLVYKLKKAIKHGKIKNKLCVLSQ